MKTKRADRDPNTRRWTKLDYFQLQPDGNFQLYKLENDPEEEKQPCSKTS